MIPETVIEAVDLIYSNLTAEEIVYIKNNKEAVIESHHNIGRNIRNRWRLWSKNSPLKHDAATRYRIAHPDDISGLILSWVTARARDEDFFPEKECERFHEHWKTFGMTSLEAGGYE